jgi:hypothetical protein
VKRLTFPAWRGDHYVGLAEILGALGDHLAGASWELRLDEVAPGPEGAALEALAARGRVDTAALIAASGSNGQVIDGELRAFGGESGEPFLVLRAVDSTEWDVESADETVNAAVRAAYPSAS